MENEIQSEHQSFHESRQMTRDDCNCRCGRFK